MYNSYPADLFGDPDVQKASRAAPLSAVTALSASGFTSLVAAPGASLKIVCTGVWLHVDGATNAYFASASTQKSPTVYMAAKGGLIAPNLRLMPITCAANEALRINLSAAVTGSVRVDYRVVAA